MIESLSKGDRVFVFGQVNMKEVEQENDSKRLYSEVRVQHIGPELRWATCSIQRNSKGDSTKKYSTPEEVF